MVSPPTSSHTGSKQSKRGLCAIARSKISEGLKRRATSLVVTANVSRSGPTPISVRSNDGDQGLEEELQIDQESSLSNVDGHSGRATSPTITAEALLMSPQLGAHPDNSDQGMLDESRMEQANLSLRFGNDFKN